MHTYIIPLLLWAGLASVFYTAHAQTSTFKPPLTTHQQETRFKWDSEVRKTFKKLPKGGYSYDPNGYFAQHKKRGVLPIFVNVNYQSGTLYEVKFQQGSSRNADEQPVHDAFTGGFLMSQTEVTNLQFAFFFDTFKDTCDPAILDRVYDFNHPEARLTAGEMGTEVKPGYESHPVTRVSFIGAREYCRWLTATYNMWRMEQRLAASYPFRLPTETEWEYAAKGGRAKDHGQQTYSGNENAQTVAWYYENAGGKTHPVANKAPNQLGLYDMSGNVKEWCADHYASSAYRQKRDSTIAVVIVAEDRYNQSVLKGKYYTRGSAKFIPHVCRGGSYLDKAEGVTVTKRASADPLTFYPDIGFRVVMSVY